MKSNNGFDRATGHLFLSPDPPEASIPPRFCHIFPLPSLKRQGVGLTPFFVLAHLLRSVLTLKYLECDHTWGSTAASTRDARCHLHHQLHHQLSPIEDRPRPTVSLCRAEEDTPLSGDEFLVARDTGTQNLRNDGTATTSSPHRHLNRPTRKQHLIHSSPAASSHVVMRHRRRRARTLRVNISMTRFHPMPLQTNPHPYTEIVQRVPLTQKDSLHPWFHKEQLDDINVLPSMHCQDGSRRCHLPNRSTMLDAESIFLHCQGLSQKQKLPRQNNKS